MATEAAVASILGQADSTMKATSKAIKDMAWAGIYVLVELIMWDSGIKGRKAAEVRTSGQTARPTKANGKKTRDMARVSKSGQKV